MSIKCNGIADLRRKLDSDMRKLKKNVDKSISKTAKDAVGIIRRNAPKAFGELRDSAHATSDATIVSAPHAAAVEVGSRPHYVPLEDLVKWVRLRGMQGITVRKFSAAKHGTTTAFNARYVARQIRGMQNKGATPIDAPERIAKKIQAAILRNGTRPHWFVRGVLNDITEALHRNITDGLSTTSSQ